MKNKGKGKSIFGIFKHELIFEKTSPLDFLDNYFKSQRRDVYTIVFSGSSGATHFVDGKAVQIPPFSLLFVGAGRLSHFSDKPQKGTHILVFNALLYNRTSRDMHFLQNCKLFNNFQAVYFLTPPDEAINYCRTLAHLLYDVQENYADELHQDLGHNIIQQILIMGTLQHHQVPKLNFREDVDNMLVMEFKELVENNYVANKAVNFYADELNVTQRRLTKATNAVLNITPKEFITKRIMEEARWKLIYTDMPIKEVSAALGFFEEHNFSSFFLKNEGVRPSQFRQNRPNLTTS